MEEEGNELKRGISEGPDDRAQVQKLFENLKANLVSLEVLLKECSDAWGYEDPVYRFYHQSFKVFNCQGLTLEIVARLKGLLPEARLNEWFMRIIGEGTGKTFKSEDNGNWPAITRPIIEAFSHARFFLEMAVKYGRQLDFPPNSFLPSGWAAFLYLYNLR